MGVFVEPKLGSRVGEWEAVQYFPDTVGAIKKILKHSDWLMQIILDDDATCRCTRISQGQMESWDLEPGHWVIRSPHDKFWFMDDDDFKSNFHRSD